MKGNPKDSLWDPTSGNFRSPSSHQWPTNTMAQARVLPKLMVWLLIIISFTSIIYSLKLLSPSRPCTNPQNALEDFHSIPNLSISSSIQLPKQKLITKSATPPPPPPSAATTLRHIVFGIAASARFWEQRKNYIKIWWKPGEMRGIVWLDRTVQTRRDERLPPIRISSDTSRFRYTNKQGHRSAIRISRIVSETLRLGEDNVRWFVMGDDDTVFVTDNLVRVLSKFDHRQFYYIGSSSESHLQNIYFSYGMAYGGGGFAISYPLAKALEKIQDKCIQRYPGLYGSDDRIQACMAEMGVPLTKHPGFHQYDVYGNLFGLLAAHPVAPLISLHHLDVVEPIFPSVNRVNALRRLFEPIGVDSAGIMQQSICYDVSRKWSVSVSWGYAVQIFRGVLSPREMEIPARTFLNWYRRADYTAYAFNTRPVSRNVCQKPFIYYFSAVQYNRRTQGTISEYVRHREKMPGCPWKMADPTAIDRVTVYKKSDPALWDRSPRRNCCRVLPSKRRRSMLIDVGVCREGEVAEI